MEVTTVLETFEPAVTFVYDYSYHQVSVAALGFISALLFFILISSAWR